MDFKKQRPKPLRKEGALNPGHDGKFNFKTIQGWKI
jgi:hypothetical protein